MKYSNFPTIIYFISRKKQSRLINNILQGNEIFYSIVINKNRRELFQFVEKILSVSDSFHLAEPLKLSSFAKKKRKRL